jgi:predicted MPP superfamily phosphohydrolase
MNIFLLLLALSGHAFLWIGLVNRFHALGIRRKIIKRVTWVMLFFAAVIPFFIIWLYVIDPRYPAIPIHIYLVLCWAIAPITLLRLVFIRWRYRRPSLVRFHGIQRAEINPYFTATNARERAWQVVTRLPMNEILQPNVSRWMLDVPRLPLALDRLSIVHISDLHFTGRIGKAYFREAVRVCNEQQPDLMCITGDIVDRACCFDWIADTLGQLTARHGVYFILGNHDLKVDSNRLRQILKQCGLIDLGNCSRQIEIHGTPVFLMGNEQPWFRPVGCVERTGGSPLEDGALHAPYELRIVLSHSPDQFAWAQKQNADLMLAGHTHGGQIRIPPLGAIFSPTIEGVKYISGIYDLPPTILHVSRGLSGDVPVRWNCRPEITHLQLRAGKTASSGEHPQ